MDWLQTPVFPTSSSGNFWTPTHFQPIWMDPSPETRPTPPAHFSMDHKLPWSCRPPASRETHAGGGPGEGEAGGGRWRRSARLLAEALHQQHDPRKTDTSPFHFGVLPGAKMSENMSICSFAFCEPTHVLFAPGRNGDVSSSENLHLRFCEPWEE